MKKIAEGWCEPFRSSVMRIPDGTEVTTINLEDWVPKKGLWDNLGGKVTMLGDAAHAMTMCKLLPPSTIIRYCELEGLLTNPPQSEAKPPITGLLMLRSFFRTSSLYCRTKAKE